MNNSRIRNTLFALGLGAGTLAGVFGAPAAMAAATGPPGQAQVQEQPPKPIPTHNPWKLHTESKTTHKNMWITVTPGIQTNAKNATSYQGKFDNPIDNVPFDYVKTGDNVYVDWTMDITDGDGNLVGRFLVQVTENPNAFHFYDLIKPEHMTTAIDFVDGHPTYSIFA